MKQGRKIAVKNFVIYGLLLLIFSCCLVFTGCGTTTNYIVSIQQTNSENNVDTYTITYSDGTTSTFTVTNGKDGQDVSIMDIYENYKEIYGSELTYAEFLEKYLNIEQADNSLVINKCLQSSLKIYSEFTQTVTTSIWPYQTVSNQVAIYSGSGVIYKIDEDYTYIITNYHVIYNSNANADNGSNFARKVYVYLYGSEFEPVATSETDNLGYTVYNYGTYGVKCELVGGSVENDIAVLKASTTDLKAINSEIKEVTFAEDYYVGQTAIAIGNPEDEGISVTEGIVSVDNEYINLEIDGTVRQHRSIRIDTAIYNGSSGGGLFNAKGELIGITNAGDEEDQNVNYAIPLQIVKGTVENIMYYYNDNNEDTQNAYKIVLGVTVQTSNSKYVYDANSGYGKVCETVTVSDITSGSIADTLGLEINDVIKSIYINTTEYAINQDFDISDAILQIRPNDNISIKYTRNDVEATTENYTISLDDLVNIK